MIQRKNRFHGHASLRYVYSHGEIIRGPMLSLKFCINSRRSEYRLAVVVSKKIMKSAVGRNRMRRRIYEQVRLLAESIKEPYDLVFTVFNEEVLKLSNDELTTMISAQLRQAVVVQDTKLPKS